MLYLGYVLLRYVLIYNLEVSFDFYLTFLQLKAGLKCSLCRRNRSLPYSRLFFSSSRYLELFSISLEGSSYRESTLLYIPSSLIFLPTGHTFFFKA